MALGEHLLRCGIQISEDFNRHARISHEWRNALDNFFIFIFLLLSCQSMPRGKLLLHGGIFCDQAWICGLSIDEPNQFLDN